MLLIFANRNLIELYSEYSKHGLVIKILTNIYTIAPWLCLLIDIVEKYSY